MANRTRPIILRLAVTEYEKRLIENKMQQIGTENFGAYARNNYPVRQEEGSIFYKEFEESPSLKIFPFP